MAVISDLESRNAAHQDHEAEYAAVNNSGVFIFLVAVVAMGVALPLAFFA